MALMRFGGRELPPLGLALLHGLLTAAGLVALIVALVGLQANMISPAAYAIVLFMTAATTLLAPPVMRFMFRNGVEQAEAADASSV